MHKNCLNMNHWLKHMSQNCKTSRWKYSGENLENFVISKTFLGDKMHELQRESW